MGWTVTTLEVCDNNWPANRLRLADAIVLFYSMEIRGESYDTSSHLTPTLDTCECRSIVLSRCIYLCRESYYLTLVTLSLIQI